MYCSDGRFGDQVDDFLHHGLSLPRYDRVVLPGGPASLANHAEASIAQRSLVDELKFLVDAHELDRVVLIAHSGCAFYSARLNLAEPKLEQQQYEDLQSAREFVREITGLERVETFFARRVDGQIRFEPLGEK
ncbi:MAG: hypothetical protein EA377_07050 [Phycisphaerales bacterium]|nr:MAG: hypothetical protein EA377_07050 [Phycisphaerales bacterium]